jgi:hypothetical protein
MWFIGLFCLKWPLEHVPGFVEYVVEHLAHFSEDSIAASCWKQGTKLDWDTDLLVAE